MMKKLIASIVALALSIAPVAAQQTPQGTAGQILGNDTAATRNMRPASVSAILDRALSSTRGSIIERGAGGWAAVAPSATVGLPWVSAGAGADPLYQALTVAGGGTGLTTLAIGDLLQASSTSALARLAAVATGNVLISGGVGVASSWGKVTSGHLNITTTTCTNQVMTALSATATATCSNVTLAMMQNIGTTTTVLHGNAAGSPTFGAVVSADLNLTTTACTNQFVRSLSATAIGTCASVAFADIATAAIATVSEYFAATASKLVPASIIYTSEVTTTFGATTTFDFTLFINTAVTLTGNITTMTLSNVQAGKAGTIAFIQDGTGNRTTVWSTTFKFPSGTTPTLSTAAGAIDILSYACRTTTFCTATLLKDVK